MIVQVYHGSDIKFDNFSFENVGKFAGISGAGFGLYFSDTKADALTYGKYIYTCILELKANVSNKKITFDKKILEVILNKLDMDYGISFYEDFNFDKIKAISDLLIFCNTDTQIIGAIINSHNCLKEIMEVLILYGYDHTIDLESPELEHSVHYIVYDLDAIEIQKVETLNDI